MQEKYEREREVRKTTGNSAKVLYAKKLEPRFRVGDLDLPERRKKHTSSREEDVATNMCPCGTIENRTHI